MLEKLTELQHQFEDLERRMSDPEIIQNQPKYQEILAKHNELKETVETHKDYQKTTQELEEARELLKDPEMKEIAQEEIPSLEETQKQLHDQLQLLLLPKDPNDNRNAIIEIRSGTGGEEAALFAQDLYSMYICYAEKKGWKVEVMEENLTAMGGIKEMSFLISGNNVFSELKFEMGTHRVQRVPATESSGRLHTSAATVAILPEAEEVDIEIDTKDLRVDTYRASGAGGQHVNKTSSAIRITHLPTNTVVTCQDERSQFQNRDKAMRHLRARLYENQLEEKRKKESAMRKDQVGSGDRSEKIRTYNFPQNRVTDHRIGYTAHNMQDVLDGNMTALIEALQTADRLAKLQSST